MKRSRQIAVGLWMLVLTVLALPAFGETQPSGRNFNHLTTGFPLSGGHATAACETCHAGGVFKGTPRNCDGCHALGKKIVATPKSSAHIVTEAACDTCHYSAATWQGARFNHGSAVPGQCKNCHNGRQAQGRPTTTQHSTGKKATESCDQCHRTFAWLPASWNHTDTVSDCSTCHNGTSAFGMSFNHLPMLMGGVNFASNCRTCHSSYFSFLRAFYNHSNSGPLCQNCHGPAGMGTTYTGVKAATLNGWAAIHAVVGTGNYATATCQSCHGSNYVSFAGARYNHSGVSPTACATCHAAPANSYNGYLQLMTSAIHTDATTLGIISGGAGCNSCHTTANFSSWTSARYGHNDAAYASNMAVNSCETCHTAAYPTLKSMSPRHTATLSARLIADLRPCTSCHAVTTTWARMNHTALVAGGMPCKNCHDSGLNQGYFRPGRLKSDGHEGYNQGTQDCITCHLNTYSYWNEP